MASSSVIEPSTGHAFYAKYEVPDFEHELLTVPPESTRTKILKKYESELSAVADYCGSDRPYRCKQIAQLLTSLGGCMYSTLDMKPLEVVNLDFIDFIVQNEPPKYHPRRSSQEKPDIVAKGEKAPMDSEDMPWHRIESVVTIVDSQSDFSRAVDITCRLLEARPDFPGTWSLVFALSTMEYRVFWTDAAGMAISKCPPGKHLLLDPSIQSCDEYRHGSPTWTVRCGQDTFQNCRILYCTDAFHRRTTVFEYRKGKEVRIIKDSFWKNMSYQREAHVLKAIHRKGTVPGVVGLHHYERVLFDGERILTPPSTKLKSRAVQERSRIVMTSTGVSLLKTKTVKDLLMALYDIIEAHRCLVVSRDILHCDMSVNNMLMYPEYSRPSGEKVAQDVPTFIATVLEEDSDELKGLIIDFDNATTLRKNERRFRAAMSDRDGITGTPQFLARSSAACAPLKTRRFVPMPVLTGVAKDRYIGAYSRTTYAMYTDGEDHWHGVPRLVKHRREGEKFLHRPDHDVETTFWSFAYSSMRLSGRAKKGRGGGGDEPLSDHARFTWARIRGHVVTIVEDGPPPKDSRDVLLAYTEDDWKEALHPAVACLAPLLVQMAHQIFPEYGLLAIPPPQIHLHEALRRLLLAHIVAMEDPVALDPWRLRPLPRKVDPVDVNDTSNWRPHWILQAEEEETTPVPEEEDPKIVLRVPEPEREPLPIKRRAEGEADAQEQKDDKRSKSSGERSQASHDSPVQSKRHKHSH